MEKKMETTRDTTNSQTLPWQVCLHTICNVGWTPVQWRHGIPKSFDQCSIPVWVGPTMELQQRLYFKKESASEYRPVFFSENKCFLHVFKC